ncbi:xylulose 5-phosphate 3-epimerase [Luteithermobacter gelatinilyticus]|uniref:xylulose 5-phosphate 3-epimerase n=1 Tax=Luteithermobacter gelatinilyticus TaxID=2582913 RepID=UPI0011061A35|nr:xylulose 5-phosphate 3-epimerase [Luteithermobacter gelatinilyticus]
MQDKIDAASLSPQGAEEWRKGYGVIRHAPETVRRIEDMAAALAAEGVSGDGAPFYTLLAAADRITNAAMWLAVHQTYARRVYLDGRALAPEDFKTDPQGHLGGSLNMIPAYVGYMLANALTGFTRSWVMGQGHAVAAIDSVNLLLNNMTPAHAERYDLSEEGLSRFAQDFYSYRLNAQGQQDSPLGSHVNPHTAGGHLEGGYLGFASLQYVHMPLPGESLVAFLSDGAFEEQRGADWTPRWWRAEDCGSVVPIMIANGRRIDQRTTLSQEGGVDWFVKHLKLHGFEPIVFDGRDPAAFAWAIWEQERRLQAYADNLTSIDRYYVPIPYGIAVAPKGAGFYNEGTNYAHNLPLVDNPRFNEVAARRFNTHSKKLFVPRPELEQAIGLFQNHEASARPRERDHPLAHRNVSLKALPALPARQVKERAVEAGTGEFVSPMDAVDETFLAIVKANPHLRPRVGNPDEMLSNRMDDTLEALEFRVVDPEKGAEESTLGKVITALNEEAVAGAAFGNKGGINLIVTYEAFGAKMFGGARQEVIFSKHQKDLGRPAKWLSVPLVLTSNTWENSKNELSHQDPSLAESMLSETSDISRVLFPADFNTAAETLARLYQTQGQIWTLVVPKRKMPVLFSPAEARILLGEGGLRLTWTEYEPDKARLTLVAIGAYQLVEVLKASRRLTAKKIPHTVSYLIEPGRFRRPRNPGEAALVAPGSVQDRLLPKAVQNLLIVSHTRPEVMLGTLQPLWRGRAVSALGFINRGGTLGVDDMHFVNRCSWAHILRESIALLGGDEAEILSDAERQALDGTLSPDGVITKLS